MKHLTKRALSLLMSVLCLLCAAGAWTVAAEDAASVTISTATARPGDTVEVTVSITEVKDVGAVGFHIAYDATKLSCVGATAEGIMTQMDMNTANTEPSGYPAQVWLTGMALGGVSGNGVIMTVQFMVKDDAAEGFSDIVFTDDKQELYDVNVNDIATTLVNGGVTISGDAPAQTTAVPAPTQGAEASAPTQAPLTTDGGAVIVTGTDGTPVTRADGSAVTVQPAITVTRQDGTVETKVDGTPLTVQGAAVMLSSSTINPGGIVTLELSVSPVTNLSTVSIRLTYDAAHMTFISGDCVGFIKEKMNMATVVGNTDDTKDSVVITASNPEGVSGSGVIATLKFQVYSDTPAGEYAVSFQRPAQLIMDQTIEIPSQDIPAVIRVEGEAIAGINSPSAGTVGGLPVWVYVVLGLVAVVVIVLIVVMSKKMKKSGAAAAPAMPSAESKPRMTNVSGEDELLSQDDQPPTDEKL